MDDGELNDWTLPVIFSITKQMNMWIIWIMELKDLSHCFPFLQDSIIPIQVWSNKKRCTAESSSTGTISFIKTWSIHTKSWGIHSILSRWFMLWDQTSNSQRFHQILINMIQYTYWKFFPWCCDQTLTWFGKPMQLSPVQCARYGWENTARDVLRCVSCRELLCCQLPSPADYEICKDKKLDLPEVW